VKSKFDVIIVGGGHAGCEAAFATSTIGLNTLLITNNVEKIGELSCNPSIGGIGKSQLVKEIDALGGIMARAADMACIHSRILNRSKGYAVRSTRFQVDRDLYKNAIKSFLFSSKKLVICESEVCDLIIEDSVAKGVVISDNNKIFSDVVLLTVGTFLNGKIFVGDKSTQGGRIDDISSVNLANRLISIGFKYGRLKTGTPPRIEGDSIDFSEIDKQIGDKNEIRFSFVDNIDKNNKYVDCYITKTNKITHKIIKDNLNRSPLYSGNIVGSGPRYCPSIEDKIVRFSERDSHQIFLEPETLDCKLFYPNGISTSLPEDVQDDLVHSINGLENAKISQYGYAIEYDFFDPRELKYSFETKKISNLFFAGQINGTTGYEEAAAQGVYTGINCANKLLERDIWVPRRDESYIGVLVDDLVTRGTKEPYRMFTSRAEFRLHLREDNADLRLIKIGYDVGLIEKERFDCFNVKKKIIEREKFVLKNTKIKIDNRSVSCFELLKRDSIDYNYLVSHGFIKNNFISDSIKIQIEIDIKYEGYIERQKREIEKLKRNDETVIPEDFDFNIIKGLSNEVRQKLIKVKPSTIGQAARIPGVTPSAISLLIIFVKRK